MKDKSLRLLMVEDSEDDALLTIRVLKKGGYNPVYERVETAAAMKKALEEKQWDIILCDYQMPTFDGPAAIALKKEANIDIPLIVLTGKIGEETAADSMRLGAQDYIMKSNLSRLCPAITRELEDAKVRNKQKQAEKDLQESEKKYRLSFENVTDVIYTIDTDLNISSLSPSVERLLGYNPQDFIGQSVSNFKNILTPESFERASANINKMLKGKKLPISTYTFVAKDGTLKHIEIHGSPLILDGQVAGTISIARDITDRKLVEEALRESEERMRSIFRAAPIGIGVVTDRILKDVNLRICEMTGYTKEELIGASARILYPTQDDFDYVGTEKYRQIAQTGTGFVETRWKKMDGTIINVLLSSTPIDLSDLSRGVTFTALDITERKRTEEALKESEKKYRLLADNIQDVVFIMDMNLNYTYLSPSVKLLRGYEPEEAMKHTPEETVTPSSMDLSVRILSEMMEIEKSEHRDINISRTAQLEMIRKDGTTVWVETKAFFMRDENLKPIGIMGVTRDITDRKQSEESLRQSEEKYRTILEDIQEGYFEVDFAGNLTFFNDSLCRFFDSSNEELMGMNYRQYTTDKENAKKLFQAFNKVYNTGEPTEGFDWQIIRKDGTKRYVEASISLQKDSSGQPIGFRGIARDVTAQAS